MSQHTCSVDGCTKTVASFIWCDMHYRRWRRDGSPGEADKRTPGVGRHAYPSNNVLLGLMSDLGTFSAVARAVGVRRESLRDYLSCRSALRDQMIARRTPRLSVEERTENNRRSAREWARKYRAENPEEARRYRRVHMNSYGPEYRHKWNHYNRLRRLELATPDALAEEYAKVLRGDPCSYCGAPMAHIDHIDAIARGGDGAWDNLTAACGFCNSSKSTRRLLDFMLYRLTG